MCIAKYKHIYCSRCKQTLEHRVEDIENCNLRPLPSSDKKVQDPQNYCHGKKPEITGRIKSKRLCDLCEDVKKQEELIQDDTSRDGLLPGTLNLPKMGRIRYRR